jgi:two-component system NtrC family sensor kinase
MSLATMQSDMSSSRILIIDDSKGDQSIYQRTLHDFELVFADSGEAGLERLEREWFDLVILDFQLPGMNGDQVLGQIRSVQRLDLPVVIVTGGGSESVAVEMMKCGAYDYLTKDDLHTPRIAAAVRGALERHWLEHARRKAERELRRQKEELESALRQLQEAQAHLVQSEKMASLGQLVAGVAHEINNPLAYVSNNVAVLDRDVRSLAALVVDYRSVLGDSVPESIRLTEARIDLDYTLENLDRLLSSTKQGVQRVRKIVVGLRDFSRIDEADRKLVNPNDAVLTTLEMVHYHVRHKGIHLVVELGELPMIWCFPGKLNQVLLNIIMNAIQAVDAGATITVRSWANPEKQEISLAVSDNGPGIPESIRGKIYDPFYTTKPQGLGTGLGLWISYNIVKEHQGRIDLETAPDTGTTFTIILPTRSPDDPH